MSILLTFALVFTLRLTYKHESGKVFHIPPPSGVIGLFIYCQQGCMHYKDVLGTVLYGTYIVISDFNRSMKI